MFLLPHKMFLFIMFYLTCLTLNSGPEPTGRQQTHSAFKVGFPLHSCSPSATHTYVNPPHPPAPLAPNLISVYCAFLNLTAWLTGLLVYVPPQRHQLRLAQIPTITVISWVTSLCWVDGNLQMVQEWNEWKNALLHVCFVYFILRALQRQRRVCLLEGGHHLVTLVFLSFPLASVWPYVKLWARENRMFSSRKRKKKHLICQTQKQRGHAATSTTKQSRQILILDWGDLPRTKVHHLSLSTH